MTNEEAIKELLADRALYGSDIVSAGDGTPEGDLMLTIDIAIAALEKKIPRKPHEIGFISAAFERCLISYCPRCGTRIASNIDGEFVGGKHQKYCGNCGQHLKWE